MPSYEEYAQMLDEIVTNPEEAATRVLSIRETLEADLDKTGLVAELDESKEKIRKLQDNNTELFLRMTGNPAKNYTGEEPANKQGLVKEMIKL